MNRIFKQLGWAALALAGAGSLGVVALQRGEPISAIWIVIAAVCVYLIAYRFYSLFIADKVLGLAGPATLKIIRKHLLPVTETGRATEP